MLGGQLMFGHQDDQQTLNDQATALQMPHNDNDDTVISDGAQDNSGGTALNVSTQLNNPVPQQPAASTDDLLSIKQQALTQLSPIVNHLDQTPEEKFKTTMMMIQASDDQSLINEAYKAAQNISDEKQKAQALLEIVNEINYFTHQSQEN